MHKKTIFKSQFFHRLNNLLGNQCSFPVITGQGVADQVSSGKEFHLLLVHCLISQLFSYISQKCSVVL